MLDQAYLAFRGGTGFALVVVGIGFLLERPKAQAGAYGVLFGSVGLLFCLSASDGIWPLPTEAGNLLVVALIYAVSQALFELTLALFGDARIAQHKRRVYLVGAALTLVAWAVPLFDSWVMLGPGGVSVEDGRAQGPLHDFFGPLIYGWPIAVTFFSVHLGRWRLRDVSLSFRGVRLLVAGLAAVALILAVLVAAVALESQGLYRGAHTGLEVLMLAWYFLLRRHPDAFNRLRDDVGQRHETNRSADNTAWAALEQRLARLVEDGEFLRQPRLTLNALAAKLGVPPYQLSRYFNQRLGTAFPAWLNVQRISWVCHQLSTQPEAKLLDLAFEAGFNSKSTFNLQFAKIVGTSPSEYRTSQVPKFLK